MREVVTVIACCVAAAPALRAADWPQLAGGPERLSVTAEPLGPIDNATWTRAQTDLAQPIEFYNAAAPVTHDGAVFAVAFVNGDDVLLAFDRFTGAELWTEIIAPPAADSWSSPVVDAANDAVIVASDFELTAFDTDTGAWLWTTTTFNEIINATPVVTDDLGPADRLFVVDADPYGVFGGGNLYCINVDPFDAALNPYLPGEIVWEYNLNATTQGATPGYHDAVVYVADSGEIPGDPGSIRAFTATGTTAPNTHLWRFFNVKPLGFFGGVAFQPTLAAGHLYAASYSFFGQQFSANLVKLDAETGAMLWSVDCNRTNSIPIPINNGRVALSTGIATPTGFPDFGSRPAVQVFQDNGDHAELVWDSALATWTDTNSNGAIDNGEYLPLGGWLHQPVFVNDDPECPRLLVGRPDLDAGSFYDPYAELLVIDTVLEPTDNGFVAESFPGAGGTPAVAGNATYSIGINGLVGFVNAPPSFDVDSDGLVTTDDLYAWYADPTDINADGAIDSDDRKLLIYRLRKHEQLDMQGGRFKQQNVVIP
jgi:outer membrane protein assembly factor BamB